MREQHRNVVRVAQRVDLEGRELAEVGERGYHNGRAGNAGAGEFQGQGLQGAAREQTLVYRLERLGVELPAARLQSAHAAC